MHPRKVRFSDETWHTPATGPTAGEAQLVSVIEDIDLDERHGVRVKLFLRDGRLHIGEASFYSRDEDGEIRLQALRKLKDSEVKERAEQWIRHRIAPHPPLGGFEVGTVEESPKERGHRRQRDRGFVAFVASRYVERLSRSRHPVKDVAHELSYSTAHIRDLVRQARSEGLLTETTPGRAGGELTPKGRKWLDDYLRRTDPTNRTAFDDNAGLS